MFVAAGDEGGASCDGGYSAATHGIGISGFASTPYNVAVGGTDFGDTYQGSSRAYWSSTNSSTYGSALSYVPEIPWNDSCAGSLLADYSGFTLSYGADGYCGSSDAQQFDNIAVAAGSGGPSGCATGASAESLVVGGTCKGYAKPSWQTGVDGIPSDGVRDIPDISLFAGDGVWGHLYVTCFSDIANGGADCAGAPVNWGGASGDLFRGSGWPGIQALVNQSWEGALGPTRTRSITSWRQARRHRWCSIASPSAISWSTARATSTATEPDSKGEGATLLPTCLSVTARSQPQMDLLRRLFLRAPVGASLPG